MATPTLLIRQAARLTAASQQAISSPAVFRSIESDTYVTIKVIDEDKYKLIFRENYGIFILWLGLGISSASFLTRIRK